MMNRLLPWRWVVGMGLLCQPMPPWWVRVRAHPTCDRILFVIWGTRWLVNAAVGRDGVWERVRRCFRPRLDRLPQIGSRGIRGRLPRAPNGYGPHWNVENEMWLSGYARPGDNGKFVVVESDKHGWIIEKIAPYTSLQGDRR